MASWAALDDHFNIYRSSSSSACRMLASMTTSSCKLAAHMVLVRSSGCSPLPCRLAACLSWWTHDIYPTNRAITRPTYLGRVLPLMFLLFYRLSRCTYATQYMGQAVWAYEAHESWTERLFLIFGFTDCRYPLLFHNSNLLLIYHHALITINYSFSSSALLSTTFSRFAYLLSSYSHACFQKGKKDHLRTLVLFTTCCIDVACGLRVEKQDFHPRANFLPFFSFILADTSLFMGQIMCYGKGFLLVKTDPS